MTTAFYVIGVAVVVIIILLAMISIKNKYDNRKHIASGTYVACALCNDGISKQFQGYNSALVCRNCMINFCIKCGEKAMKSILVRYGGKTTYAFRSIGGDYIKNVVCPKCGDVNRVYMYADR